MLILTLEPILNPIWVFLFAGEVPGINAIIGGIFIIGAVLLTWWFDYANHFPDSQASYYVSKLWNGRIEEAHQGGVFYPLMVLWVAIAELSESRCSSISLVV